MSAEAAALAMMGGMGRRVAAYYELTKPRVVAMVLLTTLVGFYLGAVGRFDPWLALSTLAGTALAAGGTLALNQYFERYIDALMERTQHRPLPEGRLSPPQALAFGAAATVAGFAWLWAGTNALAAGVTALITVLYLFAYTPLKRFSWICHVVGAVPGALPPVAGWAAARGTLGVEPLILFLIMFLWQSPHSLSIARLYQRDYERAGISMLPLERGRGNPVDRLILFDCVALIGAGALPALLGFAGWISLAVSAALGAMMLVYSLRLARTPHAADAARRVMFASLFYLPIVFLVLVLDRI
ncbi:MAG TPA: heme o synthase [Candidatus Binataceae bacterium]|jgi:protoheme IX farnesyltransferase|nr:heme o synthase [Candidatus Binataceae bacterium]